MKPDTIQPFSWQRLGILIFCLTTVWLFGAFVGPVLQNKIPFMNQIVTVADEQNIDMGAYFYTEIEASYDGERYLRESLQFSQPEGARGVSWSFISAIVICLVLLALGFRYLPND